MFQSGVALEPVHSFLRRAIVHYRVVVLKPILALYFLQVNEDLWRVVPYLELELERGLQERARPPRAPPKNNNGHAFARSQRFLVALGRTSEGSKARVISRSMWIG